MSTVLGQAFFWVCALSALVGALSVVLARNPIRSAMGLLLSIAGITGLFLALHAQFLAAIQLIVYAGAIVVLFVFVIMLLGPDAGANPGRPPRARASRWVGGILLGLFGAGVGGLALSAITRLTPFKRVPDDHGSVAAVGKLLFSKGLVPFELATALLIVAVVGAIAV